MTPTLRRIIAARTAMLLDDPFFGSLALRLAVTEDDGAKTAWTDGTTLCFAPSFVRKLNGDALKAVIAHELMHVAAGHPWRRDGRELHKFNVAADIAINGILSSAGYRLPQDALMPDADQAGRSVEWIYARLPDNPEDGEKQGKGDKGAAADEQPGGIGDVRDAQDDPGACTEQEWKQAVQEAAVQAKRAGTLPATLARFAAAAVKPRIDWRAELRSLLERSRADYSWTRPNPRYCHMGLYLPMVDAPEMPPLAIAVDTSGSIDAKALSVAKAEIEAIIAETSPAAVHVMYADAGVCRTDVFERGDAIVWSPSGGGGTDFRPACAAAEVMDPAAAALIYITDLEGQFPADPPAVNTIWVTAGEKVAPFGATLRVTE